MSRIVIVEDDKMNAKLFEVVLRRRGGFDVKITEDVEELMRLASQGLVDLVIMDVSLPNCRFEGKAVDGLTITRKLKQNPQTAEIPVILATAHAMHGDRERFLELSAADDYISKPIMDQAGLVEKVKSFIQNKLKKDGQRKKAGPSQPGGGA